MDDLNKKVADGFEALDILMFAGTDAWIKFSHSFMKDPKLKNVADGVQAIGKAAFEAGFQAGFNEAHRRLKEEHDAHRR